MARFETADTNAIAGGRDGGALFVSVDGFHWDKRHNWIGRVELAVFKCIDHRDLGRNARVENVESVSARTCDCAAPSCLENSKKR